MEGSVWLKIQSFLVFQILQVIRITKALDLHWLVLLAQSSI
jgi:hypothetical protein